MEDRDRERDAPSRRAGTEEAARPETARRGSRPVDPAARRYPNESPLHARRRGRVPNGLPRSRTRRSESPSTRARSRWRRDRLSLGRRQRPPGGWTAGRSRATGPRTTDRVRQSQGSNRPGYRLGSACATVGSMSPELETGRSGAPAPACLSVLNAGRSNAAPCGRDAAGGCGHPGSGSLEGR